MTIDPQRVEALRSRPLRFAGAGELRREENIFFLGEGLASRQVLETIFDSDNQSAVELFLFSFGGSAGFLQTEELVRAVKKNFKGYLLARFAGTPSCPLLDRAYAAGIDLVDLPLPPAAAPNQQREEQFAALKHAQSIFPRWSVLSSLPAGEEPHSVTLEKIDELLARGVLPLATVAGRAARLPAADLNDLFQHLIRSWSRVRAVIQPLRPLLRLATPLVPPSRKGFGGLLGKIDDARLRTASDLRRLLRVREVEESFESAGL